MRGVFSNHTKGTLIFASIYILVFILASLIYVNKPVIIHSEPAVASQVLATPTSAQSTSAIGELIAEIVVVSIIAIAEMRYKALSRLSKWLADLMHRLNGRYTAILKIVMVFFMLVFMLHYLGIVWFVFLLVNFGGMFLAYHLLIRKLSFKQALPVYITFLSFFILWPFSFLFIGHSELLLILADFAYMPLAFLLSALVMRHPTKNRMNVMAFLFSVMLPPVIATLFLPAYAIILLGVFSIYDFIAVFWTKHMGFMAQQLLSMNIPEAFMIGDFGQIRERISKIDKTDRTGEPNKPTPYSPSRPLVFGVGDAVLPGTVIASFALAGAHWLALVAVLGGIAGVMANLWVLRLKRHILPALPLIFGCMMVALAIAYVV